MKEFLRGGKIEMNGVTKSPSVGLIAFTLQFELKALNIIIFYVFLDIYFYHEDVDEDSEHGKSKTHFDICLVKQMIDHLA